MHIRCDGSRVSVWTPAKINLFLEVLGRRSDGYHEIETVMTAVSLHDTVLFQPTKSGPIRFSIEHCFGKCGPPRPEAVPSDASNLVIKAVTLLQATTGVPYGAGIRLVKRIPAAAGLGGASSDAAAALVAADLAWQLKLGKSKLIELASQLGSDVPFFLHNSPAICRGRGERISTLTPQRRLHVVIVQPQARLETAVVYHHCQIPNQPLSYLPATDNAHGFRLFNRLQEVACQLAPSIRSVQRSFVELGVDHHQMSGSGSAYYGICRNKVDALRVAARLRQRKIGDVFCGVCSA